MPAIFNSFIKPNLEQPLQTINGKIMLKVGFKPMNEYNSAYKLPHPIYDYSEINRFS